MGTTGTQEITITIENQTRTFEVTQEQVEALKEWAERGKEDAREQNRSQKS